MLCLEGCSCRSSKRGPNLYCILAHGPNRECTFLRALRLEFTLSRGPNQDCTPPDCSIWLIGCLPGRCRKGFSFALVLLRDTSSGARWIYQGCFLCKGTRQLHDLSGQVVFATQIGRGWKEYTSLSSERAVNSGNEI